MATCGLCSRRRKLPHVCFLAVSVGDLKVAIVTKAPKKFLLLLHLHDTGQSEILEPRQVYMRNVLTANIRSGFVWKIDELVTVLQHNCRCWKLADGGCTNGGCECLWPTPCTAMIGRMDWEVVVWHCLLDKVFLAVGWLSGKRLISNLCGCCTESQACLVRCHTPSFEGYTTHRQPTMRWWRDIYWVVWTQSWKTIHTPALFYLGTSTGCETLHYHTRWSRSSRHRVMKLPC